MENRKRLVSIDFLKGLAILLVVLGHSVQVLTKKPFEDYLFNFIYSFHMPLFMFLSGIVSYKVSVKLEAISKRFYQLIIPFFLWPLFSCLLINGDFEIAIWNNIIERPDKGLWFFWILFLISSYYYLIIYSINKVGGGQESPSPTDFRRYTILYRIKAYARE